MEIVVKAPPRVQDRMVFDPVFILKGNVYPFVAVSEGFGAYIDLIDVESGRLRICPDGTKPNRDADAQFLSALPGPRVGTVLVRTRQGRREGDVAAGTVGGFFPPAIDPVPVARDFIWATRRDEAARLFRYSLDL